MNEPDPKTDSYGYMIWILRQIVAADSDNYGSDFVVMVGELQTLASQGLDAAGECGA